MFVGALLLVGALQAGAPASDAANVADLRCVAALSATLMQVPEGQRAVIRAGVMFFYGRIVGRTPDFDIEGRMTALIKADPEGKSFVGDNLRCSKDLQEHGRRLMEMGGRMSAATK